MSRAGWPLAALLLAWPVVLPAQDLAPETATRPVGRVAETVPEIPADASAEIPVAELAGATGQPLTVSRPRARFASTAAPASVPADAPEPVPPAAVIASASPEAVTTASRPEERPAAIAASLARSQAVSAPAVRTPPPADAAGALCGVPGLEGARIAPVNGAGACGIEAPVRITAVHGVKVLPVAVVDCDTARALAEWVGQSAKPALSATGGGLAVLRTAGSYVCRSRNNEQGAQLSEHAFGRAIDITALGLRDGRQVSVQSDWNSRGAGPALRDLHKAACGPFGTVLGPDANAAHRDHFHFDTASNRSPYCR